MPVASTQPWVKWDWVTQHGTLIRHEVWEHLLLTFLAVGIGLGLATVMAMAARWWPPLAGPLLALCGAIYAVPSIALFALLVPITGFTTLTSEIGLVGYTLLILLRNLLVGLQSVPAEVREAATGMGYGRGRLLFRVELPLALPAIFAGIRIATVTTIGLVTVTALIGQGGLGQLLLDGLDRDFRTPVTVGIVLSLALAVVADLLLVALLRATTRWQRKARA